MDKAKALLHIIRTDGRCLFEKHKCCKGHDFNSTARNSLGQAKKTPQLAHKQTQKYYLTYFVLQLLECEKY